MKPCHRATGTMLFKKCPMEWWLRQQGWEPKVVGAKEVASCLGTGFHVAADHLMHTPADVEGAQELARTSLIANVSALHNSGRVIKPDIKADLEALPVRLTNAVKCLGANLHILTDHYETVATELTLPEAGSTTIDLVLRDRRSGELAILDWKCKTFSRTWYKTEFLEDFAQSWQLKHYCWGYGEQTGEAVSHFILGLMDMTGKPALELYDYYAHEDDMHQWLVSAKRAWLDMDAVLKGERPPSQAAEHRSRFGRCDYYNACFIYGYDEDRMEVDYINIKGG